MVQASKGRILAASSALYAVWGSAYLAMRFGLETIPPVLLAAVRLRLAGTLMGGFALGGHGTVAAMAMLLAAVALIVSHPSVTTPSGRHAAAVEALAAQAAASP